MADPTTPAIVGAGQAVQRPGDWTRPEDARGAIELMVDASRAAAADAGSTALLAKVGWVGVAGGFFRHLNPGQLVAEQIGVPQAATCISAISGSAPQDLLTTAAARIAAGELDVALVVGGEARWSAKRLAAMQEAPSWISGPGTGTPEQLGGFEDEMVTELSHLGAAATPYALFGDSLRISQGLTLADYRDEIAQLWARFSAVAAANPFAWDRSAHDPTSIRDASANNRMISFPYPKAMVANNTVDLASAVLLCSVEAATAAGIARDRLVFPHIGTSGHDTWQIAERDVFHEAPGLAAAGSQALSHAGITAEELAHVELYACFPSIVAMSAAALRLDHARPLTVTGGLGFAGAAIANSSGHGIAAMVPRLREGGWGLVQGNGGCATKHSFGIYSTTPPAIAFRHLDVSATTELHPRPRAARDWGGEGAVEAATVAYDREGPTHVVAAIRVPDGSRALVRSADADLIATALTEGLGGLAGPLPGCTRLNPPD